MTSVYICFTEQPASGADVLSLFPGDLVLLIEKIDESPWWWGKNSSGVEGWFSSSFCVLEDYGNKLLTIVEKQLSQEKEFAEKLRLFEQQFVAKLKDRSASPAYSFLEDESVAEIVANLQSIGFTSATFTAALEKFNVIADDFKSLASAYRSIAIGFQLFSHHIKYIANALNKVKECSRSLESFMQEFPLPSLCSSIDQVILLPIGHYGTYLMCYAEILSVQTDFESSPIPEAVSTLDLLSSQTKQVDRALQQQQSRLELLQIQAQISGESSIYSQSRVLILQTSLTRVQIANGKTKSSACSLVLFNDALMLSRPNSIGMKLQSFSPLNEVTVQKANIGGSIYLNISIGSASFFFSLPSDGELNSLMESIVNQKEIYDQSLPEAERNMYSLSQSGSSNSSAPVAQSCLETVNDSRSTRRRASMVSGFDEGFPDPNQLGPRGRAIHRLLMMKRKRSGALKAFTAIVVNPLAACRNVGNNGVLCIAPNGLASLDLVISQDLRIGKPALDLFALSKPLTAPATLPGSAIVKEFETQRASSSLQLILNASSLMEAFVNALCDNMQELSATKAENGALTWPEATTIADVIEGFISLGDSSPESLLGAFQELAKVHRLLRKTILLPQIQAFKSDAEALLFSISPIESYIDSIVQIPSEILSSLKDVLAETPIQHRDHASLSQLVAAVEKSVLVCEAGINAQLNNEEVLRIQKAFMSMGISVEPAISALSHHSRSILKQGFVKKVCRRKNKTINMFLFDNSLIIGTPTISNSSYTFNRAFSFDEIAVTPGASDVEFNILSPVKSFTCIAASAAEASEWLSAIQNVISKTQPTNGSENSQIPNAGASNSPQRRFSSQYGGTLTKFAPVWVPDKEFNGCSICQQSFSLWRRKHHCRHCGSVVCNDHSLQKHVIPTIHATERQRVCDECWVSLTAAENDGDDAGNSLSTGNTSVEVLNPTQPIKAQSLETSSQLPLPQLSTIPPLSAAVQEAPIVKRNLSRPPPPPPPREAPRPPPSDPTGQQPAFINLRASMRCPTSSPPPIPASPLSPSIATLSLQGGTIDTASIPSKAVDNRRCSVRIAAEIRTDSAPASPVASQQQIAPPRPPPPPPPRKETNPSSSLPSLSSPPPSASPVTSPGPTSDPSMARPSNFLSSIQKGISLKKVEDEDAVRALVSTPQHSREVGASLSGMNPKPTGFLSQIQSGSSNLKKVIAKERNRMSVGRNMTSGGGLLNTLSKAMASRREALEKFAGDSDDDEDDEGWEE